MRTLARVEEICRTLPECVVEGDQHHKLTVRKRTMGWHLVDHHGDGRTSLNLKAAPGDNQALVASDPERFFLPAYLAHRGHVGVYLDVEPVDWDEVRELIVDAYCLSAPKKLVALVR